MYSEDLFEKNIANLFSSNPSRSKSDFYNYDCALNLRDLSNGEEEIKSWFETPGRVISLPNNSIRSESFEKDLSIEYSQFNLGNGVDQYLDIPDKDPHLAAYLLSQRSQLKKLGIDPNNSISSASSPINSLVALGCGDGRALHYMLSTFNPFNLFIIIPDWESYISSFWYLDWADLWSKFDDSDEHNIVISRYQSLLEARNILLSVSILGLEHAYTYVPISEKSKQSQLLQLRDDLNGPASHNAIHYLGFTLDEYNMVYNSITTLQASPKIFNHPSVSSKGNCIVCGSGPSLDESLETIKLLSSTHVIISGGSNYSTLRSYGITPDFLVLVERANNTFDDYNNVELEFGPSTTRLIMSTTCPVKLTELYCDTCVYYRPALTPLALFSSHENEVLHWEGPESINGAFSFAESLGFDNIVLFGTDLGTVDITRPRSKNAAGLSPRSFPLKRPGNQVEEVFTSQGLIDTADNIAFCAENHKNTRVYNCSNGIYIKNTVKSSPEIYSSDFFCSTSPDKSTTLKKIDSWWESLIRYTSSMLEASWESRNPRHSTFKLSMQLRDLFQSDKPWMPVVIKELDNLLSLNCRLQDQIPRRIMRSTVYKTALSFSQQYYINKSLSPEIQTAFEIQGRILLSKTVSQLEQEIYCLCDLAESSFVY